MNVIEIPVTGKKIEYPSSWEECSQEQLRYIFREALLLIAGERDLQEFKIRIFYFLAGIRRKQKHNKKDKLLTKREQEQKYWNVIRAAETVMFMFSERDGQTVFDYNCLQNMFPEVRIRRKKFYGPKSALFNITFGEYRVAYDYFRTFIDEQDETALDRLCAVLYRPVRSGKIDDDIRTDFNPNECARAATRFKRLPVEIKHIIFSWFAACDNYLKSGDIKIEGRTINLRCLFKQEGGGDDAGLGLTGILMGIADTGTFGTMQEVDRTNLYTVMLRLYLWHQENERLKKLYKKNDKP